MNAKIEMRKTRSHQRIMGDLPKSLLQEDMIILAVTQRTVKKH